jgi:hypothetical protein
MYCTDDASVSTVGDGTKRKEMSPRNLLTTTITDELRMGTNFQGKVIGLSLRIEVRYYLQGISPIGRFWYSKTGSFISSSFMVRNYQTGFRFFNDEALHAIY